jgi:Retroviral aspartyl protease.
VKHVSKDDDKSGEGHKIIDSPKIITIINEKPYTALIDTGASASVCSEALYNAIKQSGAKLIAMLTCGLYCSTAIRRKKQRIKLQCMIPIKIRDRIIEIIFLVIPNLVSDRM